MGLLNKLFGSKKSYMSVLINTQDKIFKIYGVDQPTDAQKTKALVYLCITGYAILDDMGDELVIYALGLLAEAKKLTESLSMRVEELSNNIEELDKIIAKFPRETRVTGADKVTGLVAFEALYSAKVKILMADFKIYKNGPTGVVGYAPFVVGDGIFGEGRSVDHFLELSFEMTIFMADLCEAIKTFLGDFK